MRLLLTRHGETDWNRENRVLGRTDAPLNEKGRVQAGELVKALHGSSIQAVCSSPLCRSSVIGSMAAEDYGLT